MGRLTAVAINCNLIALTGDRENSLEICKLDTASPSPCLQTLCFLELPLLMPNAFLYPLTDHTEWVPTSTSYAQSRSSREYHLPFFSSAIGLIKLGLMYQTREGLSWLDRSYAMIISVHALLSAIHTDACNVPWEDWGPSSTHVFETKTRTIRYLIPVGPFLITNPSSLVVRHYDPWHTHYTQSTAEDLSLSQARVLPFISAEVFQHNIETNLPYRDVVMDEISLYGRAYIVADREWVVRVGPQVREFCVHMVDALVCESDLMRRQALEPGEFVTVYHVG